MHVDGLIDARVRFRQGVLTILALVPVAQSALAQRQRPEFTQQAILVTNFWVTGRRTPSEDKKDLEFGREVGDKLRDKLEDGLNKREAKVIDGYDVREALIRASYSPNGAFTLKELRQQARSFRTDEIVRGVATRLPNGALKLEAELILYRDIRMRQPIEALTAASFDRAIDLLAQRLQAARVQLPFQRRCENSLRDANGLAAIQHARAGIAAYPRGTLARTCLLWALRARGAPATSILAEANELLKLDAEAPHALETAAMSLDSLRRREEAARMWIRLYATDSTDLDLVERVVWAMAEGGNSRAAEPLVVRLSDAFPDNMRLMRQKWRIANDNRNWPLAISAAEKLLQFDAEALTDSVFHLRLASAYRANHQPLKAVELLARAVTSFPGDPRLYALYTQFVKEEADTVISRGLALHPGSADLLALQAKELRARGMVAEALDASRKAVELDSTIGGARMLMAQSEMDLGRPDSALSTLWRAVSAGEEKRDVARFALAKGNVLFRAANGTEKRQDFELAMRFLSLADTLDPTAQTKFLRGAAALRVAQTALTDAPKTSEKEESCALSRNGAATIPVARASLQAGADVAPETIGQFLEYLETLTPYAEKQIAAFCAAATNGESLDKP